jgi:uncharacterized repeat protein (TIGR01451 family)
MILTVTPGTTLGIHNNTANGIGTSPAGTIVTDDSQDGTDIDPTDGSGGASDGDPTNDDAPTPVTFPENPEIGVAKALVGTPINNGDGTYTLSYQILVKNTGDVPLTNVQVTDNMIITFGGAALTVNSLTSSDMAVNVPYDGTSDLNLLTGTDGMLVGEQDTINLTVTVTPGTNLGPYNNTASGQGTSTGGAIVMDDSHDGAQVDPENDGTNDNNDPTPVTFTENPIIGVAKTISTAAVSNNDGTYTLTYQILVQNYGDVPLINVQITDDLNTTFTGATSFTVDLVSSPDLAVNFPGYDGIGTTTLLVGTDGMLVGEVDTVYVTVTVTPGTKLGIYDNSATANANGTGNTAVTDDSYNGTDPDPDSNGDPTDNTLPTPVSFIESPQLGVAKVVTGNVDNMNGTYTVSYDIKIKNIGDVPLMDIHAVDNLNETFVNATSFSVTAISSVEFTENFAYDGDTDIELLIGTTNLAVGDSGTISISVLVDPGSYSKPFNNKAAAYGTSPSGVFVLDNSTDGTDVDPDGDGNPSNNSDPTPVEFPSAIIGASKAISNGPTDNGDGTFSVTYNVAAKNFGDYDLLDVQLYDTLTNQFGSYVAASPTNAGQYTITAAPSLIYIDAGSTLTVNPAFTGSGNDTSLVSLNTGDILEIGDSTVISFTIQFIPFNNKLEFENQVIASGDQIENGTADGDAIDLSDEGTIIDEDGDGIPTEDLNNVEDDSPESDPTLFTLLDPAQIGVAKTVSSVPTYNGNGTYTFTYEIKLENTDAVDLVNVQVQDNLSLTFGVTPFTVDNLTSTDFTINGTYDGITDIDLLAGTDNLVIGEMGTLLLTITLSPGVNVGPYNNTAIASGIGPSGITVTDISQDGTDVDPTDGSGGPPDGDPTNDNDPTPISFSDLQLTKVVNTLTPNVGDTVSYTIKVYNLGPDVATGVMITDTIPTAGIADIHNISGGGLFTGTAIDWTGLIIAVGDSATLTFDAEVLAPTGSSGQYLNIAQITDSDQYDPNSTPNNDDGDQSEDDEDNADLIPQQADLQLSKVVNTLAPNVGDTVSYTIKVYNLGPDAATGVMVTDLTGRD